MLQMIKRKNIWFNCPACEKKLVVDITAGGFRADCPECGKNIPIPVRSTAYPGWVKSLLINTAQALVVVMCGGMALWWALHGDSDGKAVDVVAQPVAVVKSVEVEEKDVQPESPTEDINQQLLDEHVELQGRYNKMLQWMMDNYRGKYPLPEHLVSKLRISPMTDQHEINPDLVEMLKMTEKEKGLVQDIFNYVRDNLTRAELERMTISDQKSDSITFSVPTYNEVGGLLREDLYHTLESTLGGPRFDRMVDVSEQEIREAFNYFGEASRSLTFQVIYPEVEGAHAPYVLIRDGWIIPEGESVRLTKVTETAVSTMPEVYQTYQQYLPDDISKFATP